MGDVQKCGSHVAFVTCGVIDKFNQGVFPGKRGIDTRVIVVGGLSILALTGIWFGLSERLPLWAKICLSIIPGLFTFVISIFLTGKYVEAIRKKRHMKRHQKPEA